MNSNEKKDLAMHVSVVTVVINLLLSVFKFIAGVLGNSAAMVSDSVHSASDVFSTFVVMIGVNISARQADNSHQYGHERMESIAAIALSGILFATGIGIGWAGVNTIFNMSAVAPPIPTAIALTAAVASIATKEWMYWYTRAAAKKVDSSALMADAWHHRSDALSSVGSLVGIMGARMGYPICDPIASILICVLIVKASFDIAKDAVAKLVDSSCDDETVAEMTKIIESVEGVISLDGLMTRKFGSMFFVDVEISCHEHSTIREGHDIAQLVHDRIEGRFPAAKHCMVHVNPAESIDLEAAEDNKDE